MKKRYAIVKCNYNNCPIKYKIPKTYKNRCILNNENCEQCGRHGDTKEQLVRKVAQIRFKQETQYGNKDMLKATYNMCYKQAKEIVEFLGVE